MKVTVSDVMREVGNAFPHEEMTGEWQLLGGLLVPDAELLPGDMVVIEGSRRSDGLHTVESDGTLSGDCPDETWNGSVWLLRPDEDFLTLCDDIAAWAEENPEDRALKESFGEYSVTRASSGGRPLGWQAVFADRLRPYRRPLSELRL